MFWGNKDWWTQVFAWHFQYFLKVSKYFCSFWQQRFVKAKINLVILRLGCTFSIAFLSAALFFDPLGQTTVTAGSDHCFRTCCPSVCPYIRPSVPTFQNLAKQNQFQAKTMFTTRETLSGRVDHWWPLSCGVRIFALRRRIFCKRTTNSK